MKTIIHLNRSIWFCLVFCGLILLGGLSGCNEETVPIETTSDMLIASYLNQNPNYTQFYKILDTTKFEGFLDAYGVYTCFAPNNDAINTYALSKGKTSWHQFSMDELKNIVRFHVVNDSITTTQFTDGKLSVATMYGQYLSTGYAFSAGSALPVVKGRNGNVANIILANKTLGNGILHGIDKVLEPSDSTLAQAFAEKNQYSIFYQALQKTGILDTLAKVTSDGGAHRWFTILAESDDILANTQVKQWIDTYPTYQDTDRLYKFVASHCLKSLNYLAEFAQNDTSSTGNNVYSTLADKEGNSQTVLLKLSPSNGTSVVLVTAKTTSGPSAWINLSSTNCNFKANNGLIQNLESHYYPTVRKAEPVYWSVTEQPEIKANPNYLKYGLSNSFSTWFEITKLKNATWTSGQSIYYVPYGTSGKQTDSHPNLWVHGDFFNIRMREAVVKNISFTTPDIVKGKYKIWVCCRQVSTSTSKGPGTITASFDGTTLANTINVGFVMAKPYYESLFKTKAALEANATNLEGMGYKYYTYPSHQEYVGIYVGTVDVTETGTHTFSLTAAGNPTYGAAPGIITNPSTGASMTYMWQLDMIHFIPVDWSSQIWPRFDAASGKEKYESDVFGN